MRLNLYTIDPDYISGLRNYDKKVQINHGEHQRPYVGIILYIHGIHYFAPLAHPKEKHKHMDNLMDVIKIQNGRFGIINLNNMVPVPEGKESRIDFRVSDSMEDSEKYYRIRLQKEYIWINNHRDFIVSRADKVYRKYCDKSLPDKIRDRCCNFPLLEKVCLEVQYPLNNLMEIPERFSINRIYLLIREADGRLFQHADNTWELSAYGYEDALKIAEQQHRDYFLLGAYDESHFLFMQRDLFDQEPPMSYDEAEELSRYIDKEAFEDILNHNIEVYEPEHIFEM